MSKKKAIFLLLSAILLGFLMIQPFNYICRLTDKCYPIILSYYLPKSTGKERYEIFFMTKDRSRDVQFESALRSDVFNSGADVSMTYYIKNISHHDIKIRPRPYIEPVEAVKYINFYECLCFREHKIKAGEKLSLVARFNIDRAIEKDPFFQESRTIVVGYELDPLVPAEQAHDMQKHNSEPQVSDQVSAPQPVVQQQQRQEEKSPHAAHH